LIKLGLFLLSVVADNDSLVDGFIFQFVPLLKEIFDLYPSISGAFGRVGEDEFITAEADDHGVVVLAVLGVNWKLAITGVPVRLCNYLRESECCLGGY